MRKGSISFFEKQEKIIDLAVMFAHKQGYMVSREEMETSEHPQYQWYRVFATLAINELTKNT